MPKGILGHYFAELDVTPVITLSPILEGKETLMRWVFAEELGHHFTSAGTVVPTTYCLYRDRLDVSRAEYRALRWASEFLMPGPVLLQHKRRGFTQPWEITDVFAVTEEMARFGMRLLKSA